MDCYRNGGCGPYENRSCYECPASKPSYVLLHPHGEEKCVKIVLENDIDIIPKEDYFLEIRQKLTRAELEMIFGDLERYGLLEI